MNTKRLGQTQLAVIEELKKRDASDWHKAHKAGDSLIFPPDQWTRIMQGLAKRGIVIQKGNLCWYLAEKPKRYYIVPVAAGFETRAAAEAAMASCDRSKWQEVIAETEAE